MKKMMNSDDGGWFCEGFMYRWWVEGDLSKPFSNGALIFLSLASMVNFMKWDDEDDDGDHNKMI